jgi:hypothetical protein
MRFSTNCELKYFVIRDHIPEERKIVEIEHEEAYISQRQVDEDVRLFGDRPVPLDPEEMDNSVMGLGGPTSDSLDLSRLSFPDHMSYGMDTVEPRDLNGTQETRILQHSSGSSDQLTDGNSLLESLQTKTSTPLDTWLSKLPEVDTASDDIRAVPSPNSQDVEAKEIELFRNIHIKDAEGIQRVDAEKASTANSEIKFSARIFYRNIRDRYPHMAKYLARRLSKANLARAARLGLFRVQKGGGSSEEDSEDEDSEESEDEDSGDSFLSSEKLKPEASPRTVNPEPPLRKVFTDTVTFGRVGQKKYGADRSMSSDSDKISSDGEKMDKNISYWSGKIRVPSSYSSASGSSTVNSSLHGIEKDGKESSPPPSSFSTGTSLRPRTLHDYREPVLELPPPPSSFSTGTSLRSGTLHDYREPVLELPPPPVELGTQQSFTCDICRCTVNVLRRRDWT